MSLATKKDKAKEMAGNAAWSVKDSLLFDRDKLFAVLEDRKQKLTKDVNKILTKANADITEIVSNIDSPDGALLKHNVDIPKNAGFNRTLTSLSENLKGVMMVSDPGQQTPPDVVATVKWLLETRGARLSRKLDKDPREAMDFMAELEGRYVTSVTKDSGIPTDIADQARRTRSLLYKRSKVRFHRGPRSFGIGGTEEDLIKEASKLNSQAGDIYRKMRDMIVAEAVLRMIQEVRDNMKDGNYKAAAKTAAEYYQKYTGVPITVSEAPTEEIPKEETAEHEEVKEAAEIIVEGAHIDYLKRKQEVLLRRIDGLAELRGENWNGFKNEVTEISRENKLLLIGVVTVENELKDLIKASKGNKAFVDQLKAEREVLETILEGPQGTNVALREAAKSISGLILKEPIKADSIIHSNVSGALFKGMKRSLNTDLGDIEAAIDDYKREIKRILEEELLNTRIIGLGGRSAANLLAGRKHGIKIDPHLVDIAIALRNELRTASRLSGSTAPVETTREWTAEDPEAG